MAVNFVWTQVRAAALWTKNPFVVRKINEFADGSWRWVEEPRQQCLQLSTECGFHCSPRCDSLSTSHVYFLRFWLVTVHRQGIRKPIGNLSPSAAIAAVL